MIEMNLAVIEVFLTAAKTLNFSETAELFHYTPQAVSKYIRSLETNLGVRLFQRENNRLSLTEEGQYFEALYRDYSESFRALRQEVREQKESGARQICIALSERVSYDEELQAAVAGFRARNPLLRVTAIYGNTLEAIQQGKADIALVHSSSDVLEADFQGVFLRTMRERLIVSPKVTEARSAVNVVADLWGAGYIDYRSQVETPLEQELTIRRKLEQYGLRARSIEFMPNVRSVAATLRLNRCATIACSCFGHLHIFRDCRVFDLPDKPAPLSLYCVWKRGRKSPLVDKLADYLIDSLRE